MIGKGTLSPVDAPRHLVVYAGVLMILLGEALYFQSVAIIAYALLFLVVVNLVIILIEEPVLHSRFGESYARYCHNMHRWLPAKRFEPDGSETMK